MYLCIYIWASLVAVLKSPPANARDAGLISGSEGSPGERKWQPAPGFLPEKPHGQRSLVGFSPPGHRVTHDGVTEHIIYILHIKILNDNIKHIHLYFQI